MMRIIDSMRKGKAVYWAPRTDRFGRIIPDQFGEPTYLSPVVLDVFWIDTIEVFVTTRGETRSSRAKVFTGVDVKELGMMLRGDMTFVPPGAGDDPKGIQGIAQVRRFDVIPTLGYDQFCRIAYL